MAALLRATHSLAARSPLKTHHPEVASFAGGEGRALILDTEGTFRPERILEISKRFDLNGEDVLNNIRVSRVRCRESLEQRANARQHLTCSHTDASQVNTPDHLESSLKKAAAMLVAEEYRLLVVDSIIAPFRFEYCGCVTAVKRPPKLYPSSPLKDGTQAHLPVLARRTGVVSWRRGNRGSVPFSSRSRRWPKRHVPCARLHSGAM